MPWKSALEQEMRCLFHPESSHALRYQPQLSPSVQPPVLVVGLGGLGSSAMTLARSQIRRHFSNAGSFARFLSIDSDVYQQHTQQLEDQERCLIAAPHITQTLTPEGMSALPPYVTEWLNPALSVLPLPGNSGAGAYRQVGRLMLFLKAQQVYDSLLGALVGLQNTPGEIQVFVVSGVCGGTGSGIVLDVAYLLRHAAAQLGLAGRLRMNGVLFMPDVHPYHNPEARRTLDVNGYAALKELDCRMQPGAEGRSQQYTPDLAVRWEGRPFDECYLLSADPAQQPVRTDSCARTAASFIAAIAGVDGQAMGMEGWYTALRQQHAQADAMRPYTAVQLREGVLPMQEQLEEEARLLASALGAWDESRRNPALYSDQVFSDLLFRIAGNAVENYFAPVVMYSTVPYTFADLRSGAFPPPHEDTNPDVGSYYTALQRRSGTAEEIFEPIAQRVEQELFTIFRDPQRGPFYLSRLLSAEPGPFASPDEPRRVLDLPQALERWRQSSDHQYQTAKNDYAMRLNQAQSAYNDIRRRLLVTANGPLVHQYMGTCEALHQAMRSIHISSVRLRLIEYITDRVRRLSRNYFLPMCASLSAVIHACADADALAPVRDAMHLVAPEVLNSRLRAAITPADNQRMLQMVLDDMLRPFTPGANVPENERWLVDCMGRTVGVRLSDCLHRLLNGYFRSPNSLTLPAVWRMQQPVPAAMPGAPLTLQELYEGVAPALALPDSVLQPNDGLFTAEMLILPTGSVALPQAQPDVLFSCYADRAMRLRMTDGVALGHHPCLDVCAQNYAHCRTPGVHLYEGSAENWAALPDPVQP